MTVTEIPHSSEIEASTTTEQDEDDNSTAQMAHDIDETSGKGKRKAEVRSFPQVLARDHGWKLIHYQAESSNIDSPSLIEPPYKKLKEFYDASSEDRSEDREARASKARFPMWHETIPDEETNNVAARYWQMTRADHLLMKQYETMTDALQVLMESAPTEHRRKIYRDQWQKAMDNLQDIVGQYVDGTEDGTWLEWMDMTLLD